MNMQRWSPDMRLGFPRIDAGHEAFLRELERLETVSDERFCAAFQAVISLLESDFREEESVMEEIDYQGAAAHREQHARVLAALHQAAAHTMQGDLALGRHAAGLLGQWFIMHLATQDTALALTLELRQIDGIALQEPPVP